MRIDSSNTSAVFEESNRQPLVETGGKGRRSKNGLRLMLDPYRGNALDTPGQRQLFSIIDYVHPATMAMGHNRRDSLFV